MQEPTIDSASIPTSILSKKSTLASCHRVREAVATGYLQFNLKDGKSNPADLLSKHWEFARTPTVLEGRYSTAQMPKTKGSDRISSLVWC